MSKTLGLWSCFSLLVCVSCASTPLPGLPSPPSAGVGTQVSTDPSVGTGAGEAGARPVGAPESGSETAAAGEGEGADPAGSIGQAGGEAAEASSEGDGEPLESAADVPGGAMTPGEKTAELDRELDESLDEFDTLLNRERQAQEARRQASGGAPAGGGGAGAMGGGGSTGSDQGERSEGGEDPYSGDGSVSGAEAGTETEAEPVEADRSGENPRVPPDVGSGADDDIVARQIREAAMNEEDPELREKLWDEYRAYKKGQAGNR